MFHQGHLIYLQIIDTIYEITTPRLDARILSIVILTKRCIIHLT